jgi:hypothetical protein
MVFAFNPPTELDDEAQPIKAPPRDFFEIATKRGHGLSRELFAILHGTGGVIAGGYARFCASPRRDPLPFGDVDVFCRDEASVARVRAVLDARGFVLERETAISWNYHPKRRWFRRSIPPLQVIKPKREGKIDTTGDLREIIANFDFSVVAAGLISPERALVDEMFEADEEAKRLRYRFIHCPVGGVLRVAKYVAKGYEISASEAMKLFADWDARSKSYKSKLKTVTRRMGSGKATKAERDEAYNLMKVD